MGRRPRIHFNGAIYHVWSRGVDRRPIFVDDGDRRAFLDALERVCSDASAELLAYCLMGNHFHLAIMVAGVSLAEIMRRVLTSYARGFNFRYERIGHLFQARYDAKICLTEAYLARVIPYILMNPVRAGLVSRAEDWPWSSLRGKPLPSGTDLNFDDFDPWEHEEVSALDLQRRAINPRRDIDVIACEISALTGILRDELRSDERRRVVVVAKRLLTQAAIKEGHRLIDIAKWLNADLGTVSRYARAKTLQSARPDTNIIVSNQ
ncbi:MAG: transposase [Elusimicrobiota bacterium]|nr:transposase [Elusimicrobiota bacterium]